MRLWELGLGDGVAADHRVEGLALDSRRVRPGDLFFAIAGSRHDGHAFVAEAFERGAVAVVVERAVDAPGPVIQVPNARRALAIAARVFYGRPDRRLRLLGVTGSVGKTTTALLLRNLLSAAGRSSGLIGSLGIDSGAGLKPNGFTTPEATVLFRELSAMAHGGSTHAVMEVSSHGLVMQRVFGAEFAAGIVTEIVPHEHLDFHKTFAEYLAVKRSFLDQIVPGGNVLYWADDAHAPQLVSDAPHVRSIGIGFDRGDVRIRRVALSHRESRFELVAGPKAAPWGPPRLSLRTRLLGRAHVKNAALALGLALAEGVAADAAQEVMARHPAVRRRMEGYRAGEVWVIDDTVGNPLAIRNCLEVAAESHPSVPAIVYAVRGQRGETINFENGAALGRCLAALRWPPPILTASRDVADQANAPAETEIEALLAGLASAGVAAGCCVTLREGIETAVARTPDLLLLLGAQGMDAGKEILLQLVAPAEAGSAPEPAGQWLSG